MKILKSFAVATGIFATSMVVLTSVRAQKVQTVSDIATTNTSVAAGIGCYTTHVLDCGLELGQQLLCNFTGSYGPPYNCSNYNCYGTITERRCVRGIS